MISYPRSLILVAAHHCFQAARQDHNPADDMEFGSLMLLPSLVAEYLAGFESEENYKYQVGHPSVQAKR